MVLVMVMVMVLVMVAGGLSYGQSCGVSGGQFKNGFFPLHTSPISHALSLGVESSISLLILVLFLFLLLFLLLYRTMSCDSFLWQIFSVNTWTRPPKDPA